MGTGSPETRSPARFSLEVRVWRRWLLRRSQRARMSWQSSSAAGAVQAPAATLRPSSWPRSETVARNRMGNLHVRVREGEEGNPFPTPTHFPPGWSVRSQDQGATTRRAGRPRARVQPTARPASRRGSGTAGRRRISSRGGASRVPRATWPGGPGPWVQLRAPGASSEARGPAGTGLPLACDGRRVGEQR
jgi:hypothetical protein